MFVFLAASLFGIAFGGNDANTIGKNKWNQLKTTWGINPWKAFFSVELSASEAIDEGWTQLMSCSDEGSPGNVYWKDNDLSSMPIYNERGQIHGIILGMDNPGQTAIAQGPFIQYELSNGKKFYGVTAFYRDPSLTCKPKDAYNPLLVSDEVGDRLWIDNGYGTGVGEYLKAPLTEDSAALEGMKYVKGACFWQMGVHYWMDSRPDKKCNELFPVFLLYNGGKLNAWGIAMAHDDRPGGIDKNNPKIVSNKWEHPGGKVLNAFFQKGEIPTCLPTQGELTTQHVFMNNPAYNVCSIFGRN